MGKRRAQASKTRDADEFLELYSNMRRWINECVSCHYKGLREDAPEPNEQWPILKRLHQHFEILELDENQLCEQCRAATH
jgi:hypothetical protein